MYSGCNYRIFQLKITCGLFGPNDRDLCLYEEYSIGTLVQDATDETLEIEEGMFLLPDAVTQEGGIVDHNEVCVLSGTFRFSSIQGGTARSGRRGRACGSAGRHAVGAHPE